MEFECVQITSYQEKLLHSLKISTGATRVTTVPILLYTCISVYMKREEPDQDEQQEQDHLSDSLELSQKTLKFSFAMYCISF